MDARAEYTDHEWLTLQFTPLAALYAVATADGAMSRLEADAFETMLAKVARLEVPQARLAREVVGSLLADYDRVERRFGDARSGGLTVATVLADAKALLDTRAEPSEASTFRHVIHLLGKAIAEAAPLVGQAVTAQEQAAIDEVVAALA